MRHNHQNSLSSGGSGYTLNRAALKLLQQEGLLDDSLWSDLFDSREDVFIGSMFSSVGVYVSVTIDDYQGGRYLGSAGASFRYRKYTVDLTDL